MTKAVIIVRGLDIDYGMQKGGRKNLRITLELTHHLVQICEELIDTGATNVVMVGIDKQEEAAILVNYFSNVSFTYYNLSEAYTLLLYSLAPRWTVGDFTLGDNLGIAYCEDRSNAGLVMDSYLISHGVKSKPKGEWLGGAHAGPGHEEYILEMIRNITRLQKRGIPVYNTAVILPEDNHIWRVLLQAAGLQRTTNIGAYILNRDAILRALLNL